MKRRAPRQIEDHAETGLGWRFAGFCLRGLVPVVILLALAGGVFYVRLLNGPIALSALAGPIARSLSAELGRYGVTIEDAIARLTPAGEIEFRLRDVRLLDPDKRTVAAAPFASFSLSGEALWAGRLTPDRIVLIEPRATIVQSEAQPSAKTPTPQAQQASRAAPAVPAPASQPATVSQPAPSSAPVEQGLTGADILRAVTEAAAQSSGGATTYLKELGFRQATVSVISADRQMVYSGLDGKIDLAAWHGAGTAIATLSGQTSRGGWTIETRFTRNSETKSVGLQSSVRGLVPASVIGPDQSRVLAALAAPVTADVEIEVADTGPVRAAIATVEIGSGTIITDAQRGTGIPIERGRLVLQFDPASMRVEVQPSRLTLDNKHVEFIGAFAAESANSDSPWRFALRTQQGLAAGPDGRAVPIELFDIDGRIEPRDGILNVTRAVLKASGSELWMTARVPVGDNEPWRLEAKSAAVTMEALRTLWPRGIATHARDWIAKNVTQGRIPSAVLRVEGQPVPAGRLPGQPKVSLAVDAVDVSFVAVPGLPPVDAPRGQIRIEDDTLDVSIPEAQAGPQGKRIVFKPSRMIVPKLSSDYSLAEVTTKLQGPLAGALAVMDGDAKSLSRQLQTSFDAIEGKAEANLKVVFPLDEQLSFRDVRLEGKGRVTDGRGRGLIGGLDVQGATLAVDLTDEAVDVQGDLLLQGAAAKLSAQHLLRGSPDQQPPIRITATLDAADRNQLGLDINHIVTGDVPVEISVARTGGEILPRVQANLTGAELVLESLGWRKAPGKPASLQFDIVRGQKHRTELQNFKIVGDDIAVSGWLGVDAQNKLREVAFSDFVLNVVSRLEVQGTLRPDNVWDIRAKGVTFDGRDFFRTLLQVGRAVEPAPGSKSTGRSGLDLKADIDTVLGYHETSLRNLRLQLARRADKLVSLQMRGVLDGGKPLEVTVQPAPGSEPRRMVATSDDAGQVFKLLGFYPNAQSGRMRLVINLDGKGPAEKTGQLDVTGFRILGDPVVYEVISATGEQAGSKRETKTVRQTLDFDSMRAPFSIGYGQFVIEDADIRGPLLGATLKGKVDFRAQTLQLGGTYIPLQGLNSALGVIPGLGQLLAGPKGEGVLGMTFAIQGQMAQPQVIVNPLSLVAPGIFREMFQMTNPAPTVTPRSEAPPTPAPAQSSSPPASGPGRPGTPTGSSEAWRSSFPPR